MSNAEQLANATPESARPPYTYPLTIRNLRHGLIWCVLLDMSILIGLLIVVVSLGCWCIYHQELPFLVAFFCVGICFVIAVFWRPLLLPVSQISLDETSLGRRPGSYIRLKDIQRIQVEPDPAEDYADDRLPFRVFRVTIQAKRSHRFFLIISAGEATRLITWAQAKGVTVVDQRMLASAVGEDNG
jgi:hypothetical protein